MKRSPNVLSKFQNTLDALQDLQDLQLHDWNDNFISNMDHVRKTLELSGSNVIDYFR